MSQTPSTAASEIRRLGFESSGSELVIDQLASISTMDHFPTGTLIFGEGETHDRIYFICDGTVSLEMATANCGKQRILTMGAGDLLSWSGLLGDGRMTASAIVNEPTRVIEIPVKDLRKLCESNHDVGYAVMQKVAKALSRRLLATRLQLLDFYQIEES